PAYPGSGVPALPLTVLNRPSTPHSRRYTLPYEPPGHSPYNLKLCIVLKTCENDSDSPIGHVHYITLRRPGETGTSIGTGRNQTTGEGTRECRMAGYQRVSGWRWFFSRFYWVVRARSAPIRHRPRPRASRRSGRPRVAVR